MMRKRGGTGVMSTMARTAVIAGTATAASNKVASAGAAKAQAQQQQQAAVQQQQQAEADAAQAAQDNIAQMQAQMAAMQATQAETAVLGGAGTMMAHLEQLAKLKESGILSDEEFAAAKAKLLAG